GDCGGPADLSGGHDDKRGVRNDMSDEGGGGGVYSGSGVGVAEAGAGPQHIIARVKRTWPAAGLGRVVLPIGYFANVIEMDGIGLALCPDGVGSQTIPAHLTGTQQPPRT